MESVIVTFLFTLGGVALGWYLREQAAVIRVNKLMKGLQLAEETAAADMQIKAKLSVIGETFYLSDSDGHFMAQGSTKEELLKAVIARYPNKIVLIDDTDAKKLGV
ncbi:hypothetical protein UFOVP58_100 [uncultured Caudovirales phage]|uniref:Uncharacterized protein n=1 Tax=uncultured Caudovirales phage TaxID=2100421 RepID=A0A6J5KTR1_9CAUD|nr:hypothetical protein UFOVP58_100 [uncultured Caudovirales phage]